MLFLQILWLKDNLKLLQISEFCKIRILQID